MTPLFRCRIRLVRALMLLDDFGPRPGATDGLQTDGGPVSTLFAHDEILAAAQETVSLKASDA